MELNKIYNEDCLITMQKMPDDFIDMVITSPPYDNLRDYLGYSFNFELISKELFRVLKNGGVCVWTVNDSTIKGSETLTSFKRAIYFKEIVGFNMHDTMIFHKNNPLPLKSNRYQPSFEYIFILSKGKPKTFNPLTEKCISNKKHGKGFIRKKDGSSRCFNSPRKADFKYRQNIFSYNLRKTSKHPAVFPNKLAEDMIISWSNECDIVYDPFIGSGTSAIESIKSNRIWIGSEISSEYCKMAYDEILKIKI